VRTLARRGVLGCLRIAGGLRVFSRAEVDALAASRRTNPPKPGGRNRKPTTTETTPEPRGG